MPTEETRSERVYVSMEPSLRAKLEASAIKNGRGSPSQDAWFRLRKSFDDDEKRAARKKAPRATVKR